MDNIKPEGIYRGETEPTDYVGPVRFHELPMNPPINPATTTYVGVIKSVELEVKVSGPGETPTRAYNDDAGLDLYYHGTEPISIAPQGIANIPSGIGVQWPQGYWGMVVGRSSTFVNGLLVNVGIVDPGWRGDIYVCVRNLTNVWYNVNPGERLAQLIPLPQYPVYIERVEKLDDHPRGHNGFGSSGR